MDFYHRAQELKAETIAHRRFFHQNAEVGFNMPVAVDYIMEHLRMIGLEPQTCGHGVSATIGSGGKCILLRADMDALPMAEHSGEAFACPTGEAAHTCGHDLHAAMLLTAAKMLQEQCSVLKGTVKLMFQPAEEILQGATDMISAGILENPSVDAALGFHVAAGRLPLGLYMYNAEGPMMYSADNFSITVHGRGGHAAYPQDTVNPIPVAAQLCLSLEELVNEHASNGACFLSIGQIHSGSAVNIIPDSAFVEGTIRTNDPARRAYLMSTIPGYVAKSAETQGSQATFTTKSGAPPLICDAALTKAMAAAIHALEIPNARPHPGITATASEDFARVAEAVPSAFFYLSAGYLDERGDYPAHHPKVRFNEAVLPMGAACYAHCAMDFLSKHA